MGEQSSARRRLLSGTSLGLGVLLVAALILLINYFGWKYYQRFDWTAEKVYSLSQQSENVAASLDRDVEVTVLADPSSPLAVPVGELLSRYEAASPRLEVRRLDPLQNVLEAERILERFDTGYTPGGVKVIFESGAERRVFDEVDFTEADFESLRPDGTPDYVFNGEETFTGALIELSTGEQAKVLLATGHGEGGQGLGGPTFSGLREALERENVAVEEWSLLGVDGVPEEAALVVVAGPTAAYRPGEIELLRGYFEAGGRLLILLDPILGPDDQLLDLGFAGWLGAYGVQLPQAVVFEPQLRVLGYGPETFGVASFTGHPVAEALQLYQVPVIFSLARPVTAGETVAGYRVTPLLSTSEEAWGEADLASAGEPGGPADVAGPVSLGVAVQAESRESPGPATETADGSSEPESETGGRMVVLGDADFAAGQLLADQGNSTLFHNAYVWLTEQERFLGITPKRPEQVRLSLDRLQSARVYLFTGLLPLLAIAAGVVVYFRRRR